MSKSSSKTGVRFFLILAAALLALAAGVYFLSIHGTFGLDNTHNGNCYDPIITWLLIGGAVIAAALAFLKKQGLASAVTAIAPGVAFCVFVHKCYWYVTDLFVGIDEKHGFDPKFIIFAALLFLAFVLGEAAIYLRGKKEKA